MDVSFQALHYTYLYSIVLIISCEKYNEDISKKLSNINNQIKIKQHMIERNQSVLQK